MVPMPRGRVAYTVHCGYAIHTMPPSPFWEEEIPIDRWKEVPAKGNCLGIRMQVGDRGRNADHDDWYL